ncbi:sugar transporter ERD6-like 6 [Euphorbia lathyris]|uniref:sugar transporter ERD6-like 6 n=1 Tax=Euphorbia lathyris TaxID=212925 RepID=UPI0033142725
MVGAIASSQIAEYNGRKRSLMIAAIPNIIGWLTISFARSFCRILLFSTWEGCWKSAGACLYSRNISPQNLREDM